MNPTRREFVKDSLATLGFLALPGTPMFAAPVGWKEKVISLSSKSTIRRRGAKLRIRPARR